MSCKDCIHCQKKGLLILPLRYSAVVASDPSVFTSLPKKLPKKLGEGVTDVALAHSAYGVRLLRQGYLYVMTERAGIKSWEGHSVLESGQLYTFPVDTPPATTPEPFCNQDQTSMHAYMVGIRNAHLVPNAWFLFTPHALTKAKLADYKKKAVDYTEQGKMQHFSPADWLKNSTNQTHTLLADELHQNVVEYLLYHQQKSALSSPLGTAMATQLFPAHNIAYAGTPANSQGDYQGILGNIHTTLKQIGGAAFVVHDHIGITQELNDFRNAPLEGLQHYLAAKDSYGASNQDRLQIYEAIQEIKIGFEKGIVGSSQTFVEQHRDHYDRRQDQYRRQAEALRLQGNPTEAAKIESGIERNRRIREENYQAMIDNAKRDAPEKWRSKYEKRLDPKEMQAFKNQLEAHTKKAYETADLRTPDHLKWFESERLVNAFDAYDPMDQIDGFNFAIESAISSFGLSGCKLGADKIDTWVMADSIERKNLYMRGFYNNQQELIAAAKQTYKDIQAAAAPVEMASDISATTMIKATKLLADAFDKTDAAFDEWVRNQKQNFSEKWVKPSVLSKVTGKQMGVELFLFYKASEMVTTLFRKSLNSEFDKKLSAKLAGVLYARIGKTSSKLRFDELMLKIDKSKLAEGHKGRSAERNEELSKRKVESKAAAQHHKLSPSLADLVADAQEKSKNSLKLEQLIDNKNPPTNNYHQVRIGVVLGCIELIGLGEKVSRAQWDLKSKLEIGGSIMAVSSIVLDTYYTAAKSIREIKPYSTIKAIDQGADIVRGGLKLGAGALATGAGACGAYLDYMKFKDEKDQTLKWIYGARGFVGGVSAVLTMVAAYSYSEAYLKNVASRYAEQKWRHRTLNSALIAAGEFAVPLVKRRVWMLVWLARLNWIGLALTAAEIGYLYFKDDDLQNWCEKCVFRKEKFILRGGARRTHTERYPDVQKELEELNNAGQAVGVGA